MLNQLILKFKHHHTLHNFRLYLVKTTLLLSLLLFNHAVAFAITEAAAPENALLDPYAAIDPYATTDPYQEDFDPNSTNALKRILRAPIFNVNKVRDPFVSYIIKLSDRDLNVELDKLALTMNKTKQAKKLLGSRVREPLEGFDISELVLVATFIIGDKKVAMLQDNIGKGYMIERGKYIGKNNGRVVRIEENSVILTEKTVDPAGDIVDTELIIILDKERESKK